MNAPVRDDIPGEKGPLANSPAGGLTPALPPPESTNKEPEQAQVQPSGKRRAVRGGKSTAASRVARRIARSMLGRAVTLRSGTGETIHGIVTGILAQGGQPRLVVGGAEYELGQILTVAPQELPTTETGT